MGSQKCHFYIGGLENPILLFCLYGCHYFRMEGGHKFIVWREVKYRPFLVRWSKIAKILAIFSKFWSFVYMHVIIFVWRGDINLLYGGGWLNIDPFCIGGQKYSKFWPFLVNFGHLL